MFNFADLAFDISLEKKKQSLDTSLFSMFQKTEDHQEKPHLYLELLKLYLGTFLHHNIPEQLASDFGYIMICIFTDVWIQQFTKQKDGIQVRFELINFSFQLDF